MTIETKIVDGHGTGRKARITQFGQMVTAPLAYNSGSTIKMEVINTAYNYIKPKSGCKIVIDGILLYANKSVGASDATVDIYTSDVSPTDTVIKDSIFNTEIVKQTTRDLVGLNLIVDEGLWVNGKTDDDDVFCTILYYHVDVVQSV